MVQLGELVNFTNDLLEVDRFQDYCPNGLQVQGREDVGHLVSGVTASLALIEAAVERQADVLLVHHGYFWRGEDPCIVGMKRNRIQTLLQNGISLLAYHLPLDAHPLVGNNARLGQLLDINVEGQLEVDGGTAVGLYGNFEKPLQAEAVSRVISKVLEREPLHIAGESPLIQSIAWCTGAAQGYIEVAADIGVDAYITGEVSEQTVHIARERGIHFFAAGHHATERFGVQAHGHHLAGQFAIHHTYIDIENPA